uniref:Guanylate cyclase n=1 Tax=Rhabditophanes sp. KR3021 TaxID=114890 RepID=A0AC35TVC9_9BILA
MSQSIKAPRKPIASLTEPVNLTVVFVGAYSQTVNILPYAYRMILTNMTKFPPINFNFVGLIGCSGISSVNEIERQFYTQSMDALIGPSCDQDTDAVSQLAGLLNVPVFTYGSSAIQLLGKTDLYRTLVSLTSSSATSITLSTLAFLSNLNFTRVSVIYAEDDPNVMTRVKFLIEILNSVQMDQLKINLSQNFTSDAITRSGKLNDIKGHSRLIICLMGLDISYCSSVMQVLHDLGYVSPDYLVLLPWILHTSASETYPWITKKNDIDKDTWLLYQNHIVIDNDMFDSPISDTFLASLPTTQWLTGDITSTTTHLISRIYDCMKAYMESIALAYNVSDPNAVYNGTALKQQLLNFYFDGATGPVEFDIRAARSPYYIYYMITDNPVGNQDIEGGFNKPRLNNICTNFTDDQISDFGIIEIEDTFLLTNQIAHEVQDQTEQDKPPETTKDKKKKIQNIEKDVSIKIDKNNNMAFNESDEALYKAPELLKKPIFPHLRLDNQDISDIPNLKTNMQLADAYSAGIIFFEILYRTKVFEGDRDDLKGLVDVLSGKYYKQTKTPQIPYIEGNGKENHPAVVSILQQCFDKDPSMRPSIKKIKKIFHSVLKMKGNLVDSVIAMMDKYANDLEKTVKERTKMLEDVQLRVDKLLSHMLPKEIAESLKMGQTVEPRVFRSATVLFCDICSFNLICTESNPIQIVAFLNTLFTAYDQILAKFDAYKVETQEDCMLVVSGVPKENGTNNVSIIASIALAMRNFLFSYTLLHMPKHTLEGRWGINSGSVAAGIIGLKSPRYCLFGDTVNMSSRMESTSKAGKIQMTIESRNLLKSRKDSFITKKRGTVSVKGKGDWSTYWLISSTSNDKPSTEDDHNDESDKAMSDDEI